MLLLQSSTLDHTNLPTVISPSHLGLGSIDGVAAMVGDDSSSPSSSSSVESSFRELDDVFLQSQARIWLGEVLRARFDEHLSISDLLSDGELLFEVSEELWNMLLVKYMELNNYKAHTFIPVDTRKSGGRYRPYSNVDSFLKVCKVLGLSGVDLFSPSDVVEKRDTRKVCICIRSLSKKARSKRLNVPDFDIVTKTVAMPTDVVGCIRRNLELSTCSVTCNQSSRQKSSFAAHRPKDESCLEDSDEAKNKFSETKSYSSYADTSHQGTTYLESEESPEAVNKHALTQGIQQSDTPNVPAYGSNLILCDELTPINHAAKFWHDNGVPGQIDVSHGVGENALSLQNRAGYDRRVTLSDMISFRIVTDVPFHISEDCLCDSCMGTESHDSNTTPNASMRRIWRNFPDDIEASSTSSVSSVVGRVLDFDFDFDAKSEPDDLQHETRSLGKTLVLHNEDQESQFEMKFQNFDLSAESFSSCWDDSRSYSLDQDSKPTNQISQTQKDLGNSLPLVKDNIKNVADNAKEKGASDKLIKGVKTMDQKLTDKDSDGNFGERCDELIQNQSGILQDSRKGLGNVGKEDDQLCINQGDNVHCYADDRTKAATKDERKDDGRNHKKTVNTHIVPLLKTVAKGSALIGILFLLNLRNMSDGHANKKTKKSSQIHWRSSGVGLPSKIYPVEKFKFRDSMV